MISPALPAALRTALDAKLQGLSRNAIAGRAALISRTYRNGGTSGVIVSEPDALAYALARMPATFAAVTACLNALCEARPDFTPASLLDVGAGPGTATWAAAEALHSLQNFTLLDNNNVLRSLALDLCHDSVRLRSMSYLRGEALAALAAAEPADLVVASYVIGEFNEAERGRLAERLWNASRDTLLVVEPGTPAGYRGIIALRQQLITSGAQVLAPCPHDDKCPLQAPDWCHFAQRLPRLRAHMQLKEAELPFEDEKFSYVVLTRKPVGPRPARVLAQPLVTKIDVTAKLCTADGVRIAEVPRRDQTAYARARRWRWGDAALDQNQGSNLLF
jgi:ribosomal protein RSM22 (predicted rRNA methylase)